MKYVLAKEKGRKERKEGKEGKKEGRKEGRKRNHTKTDILKNVFLHLWFLLLHFCFSEVRAGFINNFWCILPVRMHA